MQLVGALVSIALLTQRVAAVSSQRVASVPSGTGNPWFALLTKSWALASEPDQTKGLDDLAKNIVELAKSGAPDESMVQAVESIRAIVHDMKAQVNDTHAVAQEQVNKKAKAVASCQVPPHTDADYLDRAIVHGENSIENVMTCRGEEIAPYDAWKACEAEQARCSNTTECCAALVQPNRYCLNPGTAPSPLPFEATCEGTSRCRDEDVTSKLAFFKEKLAELDAAEKACEDSRRGCKDSYDCASLKEIWVKKRTECNWDNKLFEQGYCDLATDVEAKWESYFHCYDSNLKTLEEEELNQKAQLPGREQEWRALLRIDCLLGALTSSDATKALQACIDKTYTHEDWAHLELVYPTQSASFTPRAQCTEELQEPGTVTFCQSWYTSRSREYNITHPFLLLPKALGTFGCVSGISSRYCPRVSDATETTDWRRWRYEQWSPHRATQ
eukprot:Skav232202  [mRNA]  locus=scaffold2626:11427:12758:- [translate_table: standard]